MDARTLTLGIGAAVTTFLLTAAAAIELAPSAWGDSPGVGIVAVFLGLVVGLLVGAVVAVGAVGAASLSRTGRAALVADATRGVTFFAIAAMSYVNAPGVDDLFTFQIRLGASLLVALVAGVLAVRGRTDGVRTRA